MTLVKWDITLNNEKYVVELDHKGWTNTQIISLNGKVIYQTPARLQVGGTTLFKIAEHECVILIRNRLFSFNYDLAIDGFSVTTGKKISYTNLKPVAIVRNGQIELTNGQSEA